MLMNMQAKHVHRKNTMNPAKRAEIAAIREKFQREKPSLEQLLAGGNYFGPIDTPTYFLTKAIARQLRTFREQQKISLEELATRSGLDKSTVSRLETGGIPNPTVSTLGKYAFALGRQLKFVLE